MLTAWAIKHRWQLITLAIVVLVVALYADVKRNPPGFYIDESSISYNAYLISQSGRDENGQNWPLYFRAFGDFKNPAYIYLLAALFKLTGPSILVARLLSAALGVLAAVLLGLLATRITRHRYCGLLVMVWALLTPWLFELSRVVFEVALYPFVLALFLLYVQRASENLKWSRADIAVIGLSLGLLTYSYSIGRLFGPLLALGLIIFASRKRWPGILQTWASYLLLLIPLWLFHRRHPGALSDRFRLVTYVNADSTSGTIVVQFLKHYVANLNPWKLMVTGDPNPDQVAHLYGSSLMLTATALLALLGAYVILRYRRSDPWWRFILFGTLVSIIPAALTSDYVHMLRLVPLPVFLIILTISAVDWLMSSRNRQIVLAALFTITLVQGLHFQRQYRASIESVKRQNLFDAGYREKIFIPAITSSSRPIYLADARSIPGYIQAYWYGVLNGVPSSQFIRLPPDATPPEGALVITTEKFPPWCRTIATSDFYKLCLATSPERTQPGTAP